MKTQNRETVQDLLLAYGETCLVELPCHPFILDTSEESYLELGVCPEKSPEKKLKSSKKKIWSFSLMYYWTCLNIWRTSSTQRQRNFGKLCLPTSISMQVLIARRIFIVAGSKSSLTCLLANTRPDYRPAVKWCLQGELQELQDGLLRIGDAFMVLHDGRRTVWRRPSRDRLRHPMKISNIFKR